MRRLRGEELDFVERAPVRLVFARQAAAAPEEVFHALVDDPGDWPRWFRSIASCSYRGGGPCEVGTRRLVRLRAGVSFEETVLACDEPGRFVYRVDATNAPGLRALMERWRLTPAGPGGTRVEWTFAADASAPTALFLRAARAGVGRSFHGAVTALERRLAEARTRP
ncbi:SRPBCC family protein [Wenjunlia tyrosinilytica]|uniref:Polyketide cyclase n=1 Tax=Wenjunlia tyrosinilytica TaxID=1544741 RepID=A0A917ZUR1_9ACTN|nr:SRPBCC family protein [Wenjunlia tyrosinilytica]GGO96232.1 polyketide cyclase [Wenjunlia tyrosinilytica]